MCLLSASMDIAISIRLVILRTNSEDILSFCMTGFSNILLIVHMQQRMMSLIGATKIE